MRRPFLWLSLAATPLLCAAAARGGVAQVHTVTTTDDSGPGSLRQAILDANGDMNDSAITFAIPGDSPHVIQPLTPLPIITESLGIDASGTAPSDAPTVRLDGSVAGPDAIGVLITVANCTVRGLEIVDWGALGVEILGPGSCTVAGCHIHADGGAPHNFPPSGIYIYNSADNLIGGTGPGDGNVIFGNSGRGIIIAGSGAVGNTIQGNRIGTDPSGAAAAPNGIGILINGDASHNVIGGSALGAGNLISGNTDDGILLDSGDNTVAGNTIGLAADGLTSLSNKNGIHIVGAGGNVIGGASPGARNVISGHSDRGGSNVDSGILMDGSAVGANRILGNYIGTDRTGMTAVPNIYGIVIFAGASSNVIGGAVSGEGNLISGNTTHGISLATASNTVQGNIIGLAADGVTPMGNTYGVGVTGNDNLVGGAMPGARNVISACVDGISLSGTGNRIWGNFIGTDVSGSRAAGNLFGISAVNGSLNRIGDASPECGNVICGSRFDGIGMTITNFNFVQNNRIGLSADGGHPLGNARDGIRVESGVGNRLSMNSIFASGGLGIDLGGDGVTPNDPDDSDTGANDLLNFPTLIAAHFEADPPHIEGTFRSAPNAPYLLEFFVSDAPNPSGSGEGERPIVSISAAVGASGVLDFDLPLSTPLPPGRYVTATATDDGGSTSEFSPAILAAGPGPNAEEVIEALLGIIPASPEYNVNGDTATDAADAVTLLRFQ
jgi:hypothetical protein